MITFKPRNTQILVLQKRYKESKSGLIVLATDSQKADQYGTIIAVGPDVDDLKPDMRIYADLSAGSLIRDDDDGLLLILDESEVLAIVEGEE